MVNYRGRQSDSPLWKHAQMVHGGSLEVSYSMKVEQCFSEIFKMKSQTLQTKQTQQHQLKILHPSCSNQT